MIVSLSGRSKSGKSLITEFLVKNLGFTKLSFADFLKDLICHVYDLNRAELELRKDLSGTFSLNREKISEYCGFDLEERHERSFLSLREAMQYIGSDVLRQYDPDFHIKIMNGKIISAQTKNICIDDTRFPNELAFLKDRHRAHCYFILRPSCFDISNHLSEVSLKWSDFSEEYRLLNIGFEHEIINRIAKHLATTQQRTKYSRSDLIRFLETHNYDTTLTASAMGCSRDKVVWWCVRFNITIPNTIYKSDNNAFLEPNKISAYNAGLLSADGCIKKSGKSHTCFVMELASIDKCLIEGLKTYCCSTKPVYCRHRGAAGNDLYEIVINNHYIIENLKHWNLEPRKSKNNKIPAIIKDNRELIGYWIVGLIDGDGSISLFKSKRSTHPSIKLNVLASAEVCDFVIEYLGITPSNYALHKKIQGLYSITYSKAQSLEIYRKLPHEIGLSRKWNKFKQFLS